MAKQEFSIPEITDKRLGELRKRMQPVVMKSGRLWYVKPVHPRDEGFTSSPKTTRATGLKELKVIETLHTCGAGPIFAASIAEVIAQITCGDADTVVAFLTEYNKDPISSWPDREKRANWAGFHIAKTTLYKLDKRG